MIAIESLPVKPKAKMGRPPNTERRERIRKLLDAGESHAVIGRKLGITRSTVTRYARALGVPAAVYRKPNPIRHGKRICVVCEKSKELKKFSNERDSTCLDCRLRARYAPA